MTPEKDGKCFGLAMLGSVEVAALGSVDVAVLGRIRSSGGGKASIWLRWESFDLAALGSVDVAVLGSVDLG